MHRVHPRRRFFYAALGEELTAYAERYFYLGAREGTQSRREKLEADLERETKRGNKDKVAQIEADLTLPDFPKALAYLWRAYHRMRRRKAMGFAGPNPLEWPDIDAYSRQTGTRFLLWEIETLEAVDDAFLVPALKQAQAPPQPQGKGLVDKVDINDGRGVRSLFRSIADRRKKKGG